MLCTAEQRNTRSRRAKIQRCRARVQAIGASFSGLPTPYDPSGYGGAAAASVEIFQILMQSAAMASNTINLSHGLVEVETQINRDGEKRAIIRIGKVIILNGVPAAKTDYLATVGNSWDEHVRSPCALRLPASTLTAMTTPTCTAPKPLS